jgi:hypothetical protein
MRIPLIPVAISMHKRSWGTRIRDSRYRFTHNRCRLRLDLSVALGHTEWQHDGELHLRPSRQPAQFAGRGVIHQQHFERADGNFGHKL